MLDALWIRNKMGKSGPEKEIPSEKSSRKVSSVWPVSREHNGQVPRTERGGVPSLTCCCCNESVANVCPAALVASCAPEISGHLAEGQNASGVSRAPDR